MEHRVKWNCKAGACCLAVVVSASAGAQAPDATAPSDTLGTSPSAEVLRQKIHLSAQAIDALLVKGQLLAMQKAAGSATETSCLISLWYGSDGTIHAVQLVKASGFPLVDQACLQAAIGRRVESIPADRENGGQIDFPIHWFFNHEQLNPSQLTRIDRDSSIPRLQSGGAMNPLPPYPAEALAQRAHGICRMHIAVTEKGAVSSIEITQSTGSAALDEACKQAIYGSPIMPATKEGQAVSGTTDVAIDWRLPRI
jgi:TonB family protein